MMKKEKNVTKELAAVNETVDTALNAPSNLGTSLDGDDDKNSELIKNENDELEKSNEADEKNDTQNKAKMSLKDFEKLKIKVVTKNVGKAGICTIVNSKSNGKRVVFPSEVIQKLGTGDKLEVHFGEKGIAITKSNSGEFILKQSGKKSIVYCTELVAKITEKYNLGFVGRVSLTFHSIEYFKDGNVDCAYIELV